MTIQNLLGGSLIGICGILTLVDGIEENMVNYDKDIRPPVDNVSIILPTYNEGPFIQTCSESLRNQSIIENYPEYFEIILVDSLSDDETVELASPYVDKIIFSPRGKLTAINLAINQSKGNIIVSVDGDTYYPYHWLNTLLGPFNRSDTAGVVGSTFDYNIPSIPGQIYTFCSSLDRFIVNPKRMQGRNCSFWKHLYYLSGKFNENINQMDAHAMIKEEEIDFGNKLSKYGNIVFKISASCYHYGGFRISCREGFGNKEICDRYGFGKDRF